jgi:exodeoxyribonuclease VII large subunit
MVQGEVSRVTYHTSGHLYFTLKDSSSAISCVMFKGNNLKLKFRVEEGMEVIISGGISVYSPRGTYQINCATMEPSGSGALALAYEQLKNKLQEKGYFEQSIKKTLPKFPKHIVLITSKTGAAIEDMKRVAQKRWPLLKLTLIDTIVQGDNASKMIAKHIKLADKIDADIIVVGRGGGSIEDLWAFNEEIVADAIYKAKTPIVSAIGHEIDTLICDFCADLRAPTPSAAMELILPDINEIRILIDNISNQYYQTILRVLEQKSQQIQNMQMMLNQHSFEKKLQQNKDDIKALLERFNHYKEILFLKKATQLSDLIRVFEHNDPKKRDKFSYAQILKNGNKIDISTLKVDDNIEILNSTIKLQAKVLSKTNL